MGLRARKPFLSLFRMISMPEARTNCLEDDGTLSHTVIAAVNRWADQENVLPDDTYDDYKRFVSKKWIFMGVCLLVAILVAGYTMTIGPYNIGFLDTYRIVFEHIIGNVTDTTKDYVIIQMRMPRIVVGLIAGAGLAVAGVAMQSTLMNPLADPYTTGVSSGALFGATIAMTLGISVLPGNYALVGNAFLLSLVPMAAIIIISKLKNASPTVMIMAGIAIMYVFNACTTVMMLWADPNDLAAVYQWQVGTLGNTKWDEVPIMLAFISAGLIAIMILSRKLNILSIGDEMAKSLGVNADNLRLLILAIVALMCAAIVSFTGLIGFVGLVAPHVVRLFIGADNKYLVPASALFGAMLVTAADLVGRVIIAPATLQVGVVMAFLGGPVFLWLIIRKDTKVWG